jgi:hypothetical protein
MPILLTRMYAFLISRQDIYLYIMRIVYLLRPTICPRNVFKVGTTQCLKCLDGRLAITTGASEQDSKRIKNSLLSEYSKQFDMYYRYDHFVIPISRRAEASSIFLRVVSKELMK